MHCDSLSNFECINGYCQCIAPYVWTGNSCDCPSPLYLTVGGSCGIIFDLNLLFITETRSNYKI